MKKYIPYIVIFLVGLLIGLLCRRTEYVETIIVERDTTVVVDTHIVERPVPVRVTVTDTLLKEVTDTVRINDTLYVPLPLERKEYRRDEFYAVVSGYNPSLIHMEVYPKTVYVTEREVVRQRNYLSVGAEAVYIGTPFLPVYLEYERKLHRNFSLTARVMHDFISQENGVSVGVKAEIGW